jgi:hypothetical protein
LVQNFKTIVFEILSLKVASTFAHKSGLVVAVEAVSSTASLLEGLLWGMKECKPSPALRRSMELSCLAWINGNA